jgi:DNA replication and repair protein RecF
VFLGKLALLNFKNHPQGAFSFTKKINCIIGPNGTGKTNLLDSIYYLCLTKSYFNSIDQQNILFGQNFLRLEGQMTIGPEPFNIVYKLQNVRKKELIVNDLAYSKLSEHIGRFPAIIVAPDDNQLILGGSEERRKFLDSTLSQVDVEYLENLILYNKVLEQRNATLRRFAETGRPDKQLIETYDEQLAPAGEHIYKKRKAALERLNKLFKHYYGIVSLNREEVDFSHVTQLNEQPLKQLLAAGLNRDMMLQRTDTGVHKDDVEFIIRGNKVKKFGSQGQQKSFIIGLKFAQYQFISEHKNFKPLLLIDDIFDKLDEERSKKLIELISGNDFGQVFITDTDDKHIIEALADNTGLYEIFRLEYKNEIKE